jgi:hypothetical protein
MNQHNHRWSFISKEQRRQKSDQENAQAERFSRERATEIESRTHLEHHGRKGYLGFAKDLQALLRHSGNLPYARWVLAKSHPAAWDESRS